MDAFVSQVNQLMEEIMSSTFHILESSRVGDEAQLNVFISNREGLFSRLNNIFKENKFTDLKWKSVWRDQLAQVNSMDEEIRTSLKLQSKNAKRELRLMETQKIHFLKENQINPRGTKLEIKG